MPRQGLDIEDTHHDPRDDEQREVQHENHHRGPVVAHERRGLRFRRRRSRSRSRPALFPDRGPRRSSPGEPGARRGRAASASCCCYARERLCTEAGPRDIGIVPRAVGGTGSGARRRLFCRRIMCCWRPRGRRWRFCVAVAVAARRRDGRGPEGRCHIRRAIICLVACDSPASRLATSTRAAVPEGETANGARDDTSAGFGLRT